MGRKIDGRELVADVSDGLDRFALMDKYGLSQEQLKSVLGKLANSGKLSKEMAEAPFAPIGQEIVIRSIHSDEPVYKGKASNLKALLEKCAVQKISLEDADLANEDLSSANLSGLQAPNSDLSDTNLSGAKLTSANLSGSTMGGVKLSSADLSKATISSSDLTGANLDHANLKSADLMESKLRGASLVSAVISNANLTKADFSGADLRDADLSFCSFAGGNITGANMEGVDLEGTDLSRVHKEFAVDYDAIRKRRIEKFIIEPAGFVVTQIVLILIQSVGILFGPIAAACFWGGSLLLHIYPIFFVSKVWFLGFIIQALFLPITYYILLKTGTITLF